MGPNFKVTDKDKKTYIVNGLEEEDFIGIQPWDDGDEEADSILRSLEAYKLSAAANSTGASPAMQHPVQPDIHLPEHWEDNAAFDTRMQGKKDYAKQLSDHAKEISNEAKLQNLDAQAAMAASKARQARQARIVNPNSPAQGSQQ